MGKNGSNVFIDTTGVLANQGLHSAANVTITKTEHVGKSSTKYGTKDFQMFHIQVKQFNSETGESEIAEIHQQFHRSFSPQSSLTKFLAACGFQVRRGMRFDFDDLVGCHVAIVVMHSAPDANGKVHANVVPFVRNGGAQ